MHLHFPVGPRAVRGLNHSAPSNSATHTESTSTDVDSTLRTHTHTRAQMQIHTPANVHTHELHKLTRQHHTYIHTRAHTNHVQYMCAHTGNKRSPTSVSGCDRAPRSFCLGLTSDRLPGGVCWTTHRGPGTGTWSPDTAPVCSQPAWALWKSPLRTGFPQRRRLRHPVTP